MERSTPARPRRPPRGGFHPLTVADTTPLCADAAAVTLAVPPALAEAFAFRAGQWLTLRRTVDGREERRSYSICAPEGAAVRIGVREVPGGLFSRWLVREVRPGDTLEVAPPAGAFTPEPGGGRHVLLGAGSGITPLLSIAATVLRHPDATVALVYGNRASDTAMFVDELADLKDRHPARLELYHVLSREPREVELFSGRLDGDRLARLLPLLGPVADVDHWWLCGPYGMVRTARALLLSAGAAPGAVHQELFFVDDAPPPTPRRPDAAAAGAAEVTVVLDGRTTTVRVPPGTSVLEGAQRARPDLPFACKGGVCGTCRARVTAGEARMVRNFALEEAEVAAGYVLTCQARPATARLTVDYSC